MKKSMIGVSAFLGAMALIAGQIAFAQAATVTGGLGASVSSVVNGVTGAANANIGANASGSADMSSSDVNASGSMDLGLQAELSSGTVTTSSDEAVVNLEGGTASLIESTSDLQAYGNLVVAARPVVKGVSVNNGDSVAIRYSQPAKFLWMFPATLTGEVDVDAAGNATVHLPWYAFLYAADTASVQSTAATAIDQSGATFGSDVQADSTTDLQNKARIVNAVSAALEAQMEATANVSTTGSVGGQ